MERILGYLQKIILMMAICLGFFVAAPTVSFAQELPGLISEIVPDCDRCGYCQLAPLAENIMQALIAIGMVIAVLMIMYAGFLYVSAMGDMGQVTKAHNIFKVGIIGLIIILAAWLIINLIVTGLGVNESFGDPWTLPGSCPAG